MEETVESTKSQLYEKLIVTDPELIKKYDQMTLYIPQHEKPETLDIEMMTRQAYAESAVDDGQFRPIEVAVWEEDPNKDDPVSYLRFHLRIINGRHRYLQNPNWQRVYYKISSPTEYWKLRKIADMQKHDTPQEITVIITEIAEMLVQTEGLAPKECCTEIIKRKLTKFSRSTIIRHCPEHYKETEQAHDTSYEATGKETKLEKVVKEKTKSALRQKEDEIAKIRQELDESLRQSTELESQKKKLEEELISTKDKIKILCHTKKIIDVSPELKVAVTLDIDHSTYIIKKV